MIAAITGANGFIGRHLVRRFAEAGWEVRPVVRGDYAASRLEESFAGADVVVHAAGVTRAPTSAGLTVNATLTEQTAAAARRGGVPRFVLLSSQAAAGPASSLDTPVREDAPPAPIEAYGRAKLEAERLVRESGIPFVILRPAAVYGPGDRDFLALFRLTRRGIALHAANRGQWISIVHVRDLCAGIVQAATDDRAVGETLFLANAEPVQWSELFRLAARCAGRTLSVDVDVPRLLVDIGATLGDVAARLTGTTGLLTSEKVALSKPPFFVCSSERARRCMDFATPTPLQEGVCETYHWYLANDWL
jgi:nucleoside-diphosphate-sugar epimerase